MKKNLKYLFSFLLIGFVWTMLFTSRATSFFRDSYLLTAPPDTSLPVHKSRLKPVPEYPTAKTGKTGGLQLKDPPNIKDSIILDPETGEYVIMNPLGNTSLYYRPSRRMSFSEYLEYSQNEAKRNYWKEKALSRGGEQGFAPRYSFGGESFDKIFGTNVINIQPQGSAELIFGYNVSKIDNPTLPVRLRKTPSFNFEERIQMNVQGTIGNRVKIGMQYNTEATFEFENKTKLEYTGEEDEIIKKIEVGNITMPLSGSLITGSHSLFGIKTEMQFGRLYVTTVLSQQKGQSSTITVQGGAQTNKFEVFADQYEANKHFFLSHFFKEKYDEAMKNIPVISSGIQITRVEVWITNKAGQFESSRNIVAFMDLGEADPANFSNPNVQPSGISNPDLISFNEANTLYNHVKNKVSDFNSITSDIFPGMKLGSNFEKIENARKLTEREFTYHPSLGYISLNTALNADEVLAVAYEFQYRGVTYQVGEFSTEKPNTDKKRQDALVVKLLKGTNFSPNYKNWTLMMKNIYSLNAYQISPEDFTLYVLYQNDRKGTDINYLPESQYGIEKDMLIRIFNLDSLNSLNEPHPDGMFDYIEGVTINAANGRIIFPVREPFGKGLYDYFLKKTGNDSAEAKRLFQKYGYPQLYDSTLTKARLVSEKNKFKITGTYKSTGGSEIALNAMNIPQGSVKVTANGIPLVENQDYTVDYTLGRVKILNEGVLRSGNPIKVSLENQSLFNMQTKTLVGTNLIYKISDDFKIGGTIMHLNERPLTQKVNLYSEPISNTIWGLNGQYRTESNFLTSLVDKLPFFSTKTASEINLTGEFAQLIPGSAKAIGKNGVAYIDDFEGSETTIELKSLPSWHIASIPRRFLDPPGSYNPADPYSMNYRRAKLCWYVIDPLFTRNNNLTPPNIKEKYEEIKGDHFVREVPIKEIFPNMQTPNNLATTIPVFNLAFYPSERGPYNYNPDLDEKGNLKNPASNWGGVMRELQTTDFEAANVQYLEFWLMDPYWKVRQGKAKKPNVTGSLFINLGDISEDVLPDNRKSFENGLPRAGITDTSKFFLDTTAWAIVPTSQSTVKAFDNDEASRKLQDVGLDGMNNETERKKFSWFLDQIRNKVNPDAYTSIENDPSADDYHYFRGADYDQEKLMILDRYKKYNGLEGNSPAEKNTQYPTAASTMPDDEDINRDNTLNISDNYFEYEVPLNFDMSEATNPYITSEIEGTAGDGPYKSSVKWFQFKVPLVDNENMRVIGDKQDFKSIRFLRLYLTGFEDTTILRFAKLELVRGEWRKYNLALYQGGEYEMIQSDLSSFDVTAVNIEKNSGRKPVNYVLPPGIDRVIDPTNPQLRMLNEQAMVLRVKDLQDGDARAVFKTVNLDLRQYKRLKMFVHGEAPLVMGVRDKSIQDGEITVFIRIGADYTTNYYEYEIPLKLTNYGETGRTYLDNTKDRLEVWPIESTMDIDLEIFQQLKLMRNEKQPNEVTKIFSIYDGEAYDYKRGKAKISIRGNPSLSNIRAIMIGVRNPNYNDPNMMMAFANYTVPKNDGRPKSVEVWVNELRLTDFNNRGGWGANARSQIKLADLGVVSISGSTMKPGFGSIEKKVNEREKVETNQLDVAASLDMGKFFKEEAAVQLPVYAAYSKTVINPQYNPLQPDIPLDVALNEARNRAERDSIKKRAQDYTERVSFNITNARVGKPKQKPKFYDPANFSTTFAYNHIYSFNPTTFSSQNYNYRGGINYMFNQRPEPVQPFKNVKAFNNKYFALLRDFNFYYKPQAIMFRTEFNRNYRRTELRNLNYMPGDKSPTNIETLEPSFMKDFLWNRMYDIKFDLTRSLKLTYNAMNTSRIDEYYNYTVSDPNSPYYRSPFDDPYYARINRDTMWKSILHGGRNLKYNHNIDVTYTIPVNKLPGFDWLSSSARYGATYSWDRQPPLRNPAMEYGNTIKNSNQISLSAQANMVSLYNKVPYLKKINQPVKKQNQQEFKTVTYEETVKKLKGGSKKTIKHNLGTEEIKVVIKDKNGTEVKGKTDIIDKNKIGFTPETDQGEVNVKIEGKVPVSPNILKIIADNTLKVLMGVKNIGGTYSVNQGTTLPGFQPQSQILGMDPNNQWAPGLPFIFGMQDNAFYKKTLDNHFDEKAFEKGWTAGLNKRDVMNVPMLVTHSNQISVRSSIEPFAGLKIDVSAMRNYSESLSKMYLVEIDKKNNGVNMLYDSTSTLKMTGNLSMSFLGISTFFEKLDKKNNYTSAAFENFRAKTIEMSQELSQKRIADNDQDYLTFISQPDSVTKKINNYAAGYGPSSQDVLIPAFLSAYSGINMNNRLVRGIYNLPLNQLFLMMPNWRVTFDGLNKLEVVKKYFKSIVLTHAYQATYNIGSFISDYKNVENALHYSITHDLNGNYRSKYAIGSISINEAFNPLLGFDMTWNNNITTRLNYRSSRNLVMSFYNNQLTETRSQEWTVGLGYRITDLNLKLVNTATGKAKDTKNDLKLQCDVSMRDDKTLLRKLVEETITPNAGKNVFTIKLAADYMLGPAFTLRIFYDRILTNPFVSNAFKTTNSNFGFSVRFTLVQQQQ